MAVSLATFGSFPVIPQLYVPYSRRCADEEDVNCFTSIKGCHSPPDRETLRCDDPEGWSVSLVFVGTGAEFPWASNCTVKSCMWSIDDVDCGITPPTGGPMEYLEGLMGGGDTKHTFTMFSTEGYAMAGLEYATIHTRLDTLVGEQDDIWIPASYSMLDYQGNWKEIDDASEAPPVSQFREPADGNASVSIDLLAESVHFRHHVWGPSSAETYMYPNWTVSINGDPGEERREPVDLTPAGRNNITLLPEDPETTESRFRMEFLGLSYRPLSNVTRIRDVTPLALVEAAESFDYSKLVGTDTQCRDHREGGAFGLHGGSVGTIGLVWSAFASASYVVWYA
ncbi:hypothetical protein BDV98DRAFT_247567 [Pterulicium gracile]|uniref:Uncharacterized protein n=1 Tax=Pterulicium gracile TaxID=1884261 RepID=A0A5C3QA55_9AGAR|nr:hypothetical protein BDV98DRAFT_247567 [Pterula gracilis]